MCFPTTPPTERVRRAFRTIEEVDRPEVWIHCQDELLALADARSVEARVAAGEALPLAGATLAVKDNIDVAGMPTTAACAAFAYRPTADASAVSRLKAAGAIVIGKTNMDQFATGLVGTRSPYGAVRDARDPERVSGGSSSGSAVAVALGIADLGLATDTAGSGRIPAAFQGIVAIKPTRGLVPTAGVVPACKSFDCVSIFARTLGEAQTAMSAMAPLGAGARPWFADAPAASPAQPRLAIGPAEQLGLLSPEAHSALAAAADRFRGIGAEVVEIDLEPFLAAGELLYGGALVAERYAAVGSFVARKPEGLDPSVASIILAAASITPEQYRADLARLDRYRSAATEALAGFDALLLPTAPRQPTIQQVEADPLGLNRQLGTYTSFCNLLDMCAVVLPCGHADGGCFGATLAAPACHDAVLSDLGRRLMADQ